MKLLDLVHPDSIIAELASTDRNGAIRELVQILADGNHLAQDAVDRVVKSIITRERTRGTTGFGKGVAVPHAKLEGLHHVVAAVGRSTHGIDFSSLDGEPVYAVFLIASPEDQPEEHLRAMDLVFRHLQQEKFRKFLRQSDAPEKVLDLLKEADEKTLVA
ncbi:MAG: PTS sugar transporter subunit IIA [Phycisphaerae bacterium]|jgi:mannitol/fructose-specific phosphotransferase system IIA component (Ntr-type)